MEASELNAIGEAVWGEGWRLSMSRALTIEMRTVRRMAAGKHFIPEKVAQAMRAIKAAQDAR